MIFLINDANILIDLLKIDLIDHFFQLEYDFQVTDMVVAEVEEDHEEKLVSCINNDSLTKQVFSMDELVEIQHLSEQYSGLSVPDCSCLYLAKRLNATLLTGDVALRKITGRERVSVHGILWVFDELLVAGHITSEQSVKKLEELMMINQRLPVKECKKRLQLWRENQ